MRIKYENPTGLLEDCVFLEETDEMNDDQVGSADPEITPMEQSTDEKCPESTEDNDDDESWFADERIGELEKKPEIPIAFVNTNPFGDENFEDIFEEPVSNNRSKKQRDRKRSFPVDRFSVIPAIRKSAEEANARSDIIIELLRELLSEQKKTNQLLMKQNQS